MSVIQIIYFTFLGSKLLPNNTSARYTSSTCIYQPQVGWSSGCKDSSQVSVPPQPQAGLQPGQRWSNPRPPNVPGSPERPDHRMRRGWYRRMGPGCAR